MISDERKLTAWSEDIEGQLLLPDATAGEFSAATRINVLVVRLICDGYC